MADHDYNPIKLDQMLIVTLEDVFSVLSSVKDPIF